MKAVSRLAAALLVQRQYSSSAAKPHVGWVERSDTHHRRYEEGTRDPSQLRVASTMMGVAALDPSYMVIEDGLKCPGRLALGLATQHPATPCYDAMMRFLLRPPT